MRVHPMKISVERLQRFVDRLAEMPKMTLQGLRDIADRRALRKHNRAMETCKDCRGSPICEHTSPRQECEACGKSSICEHNCGIGAGTARVQRSETSEKEVDKQLREEICQRGQQ